ncbi:kinesin-like nuclear fusion protein [Ascosphaera acerosa]|nr:kinesin-like nuclear fusion protein [Ascosphaera acerosa]
MAGIADENHPPSHTSAIPRLRSATSIPRLADITARVSNQEACAAAAAAPATMPAPSKPAAPSAPTPVISTSTSTSMPPPPRPASRTVSTSVSASKGSDPSAARGGLARGRSVSKRSSPTSATPASSSKSRPPSVTRIARPASATGHHAQGSLSGTGTGHRPQSSATLRRQPSISGARAQRQHHDGDIRPPASAAPPPWDPAEKLVNVDSIANRVIEALKGSNSEKDWMLSTLDEYKRKLEELEAKQAKLVESNIGLRVELDAAREKLSAAEQRQQQLQHEREQAVSDAATRAQQQVDSMRRDFEARAAEFAKQKEADVVAAMRNATQRVEEERERFRREAEVVRAQADAELQRKNLEGDSLKGQVERLRQENDQLRKDVTQRQAWSASLESSLETSRTTIATLESSIAALKSRIDFLESGSKAQSESFSRLDQQLREALAERDHAKEKLLKEETVRRKLHNQVQELKGNIRVFCRVRPPLRQEPAEDIAAIAYPDADCGDTEISVQGPEEKTAMGTITTRTHTFEFDRVFGPAATNAVVFDEISQLVQSALDGFNVCIFCYGQTGSGKTYTMGSTDDGMIPRAVRQIFSAREELAERGWEYEMEGCFVEVYNEQIHDLIGSPEDLDKKRCEIRHDLARQRTDVVGATVVPLTTAQEVNALLRRADRNRSVGATKANERSSRSHSVFILRMRGTNRLTGEQRREGVLNLVDLAGSERLNVSGSEGLRLKETQSINRSLSCLGDVIAALGEAQQVQPADASGDAAAVAAHIPYRNSKLTYLLQFSLGGTSKTLMFVNVSPRRQHLGETLTSLKFAVKVSNVKLPKARRLR